MDTQGNPIFQRVVESVKSGQTSQLTCTAEPAQRSMPRVPPLIQKIIAGIGFRYPPSVAADKEAHAARLALLAADVSHVPPALLERAATRHARQSEFMPKAAELIAIARQIDAEEVGKRQANAAPVDNRTFLQELADRYNANQWPGSDRNEWHVTDFGELKLRPTQAAQRAAIAAQNAHNEAMGSAIRIPMGAGV